MLNRFYSRLRFRTKLCLAFLLVFTPLMILGSGLFYVHMSDVLRSNIETQMDEITAHLAALITKSATVSLKRRLEAVADKALTVTSRLYDLYSQGLLSRETALNLITKNLSRRDIGISGYIACLDGEGTIISHPRAGLKGKNILEFQSLLERELGEIPVRQFQSLRDLVAAQNGYLEYDWQNPGESGKRPKALQWAFFKPLDWSILVSAYRDEFNQFTNITAIRDVISSITIKKSGMAFVFDSSGTALIHPDHKGGNLLRHPGLGPDIRRMVHKKNGTFLSTGTGTTSGFSGDTIYTFRYIPGYDWIVATAVPVDDIFYPLEKFTHLFFAWISTAVILSMAIVYCLSLHITAPLEKLVSKLRSGRETDFSIRMNHIASDEIGILSTHFDRFMGKIEKSHLKLMEQTKKTALARERLERSESKFKGLFNQSFHFICILSPEGALQEANQSALDFIACPAGQIRGLCFWELPCWEFDGDVPKRIRQLTTRSASGETSRFEAEIPCEGDCFATIDISVKPIKDTEGNILFLLAEGRDVTQIKKAEAAKRDLAIRLEKAQKMEAIGTLSGGIAHDFNNILLGIFGYCELAEKHLEDSRKIRKYISRIYTSAKRAADLVRQILACTRKSGSSKKPVAMRDIVEEAVQLVRAAIPKGVKITTDMQSNQIVSANPSQLHQVAMNLLTNAYQAIGSESGTLSVSLYDRFVTAAEGERETNPLPGAYCVLCVADTGCGMEKEVADKIFDPYFTTKQPDKGTGLGLAVVKGIVEEHNGFLVVDSTPGKGSEFRIFLPTAPGTALQKRSSPVNGTEKGGRGTIMIVDDEADIRFAVGEYLRDHGYQVRAFENPVPALEAFVKFPGGVDLILTDMSMPEMNGFDFVSKILEWRKDMPVLLLTGYSDEVTEEMAMARGIRYFVRKPVSSLALLDLIRSAMDA